MIAKIVKIKDFIKTSSEQYVVLQVKNSIFEVFDANWLCDKSMEGKNKLVEVLAFLGGLDKNEKKLKKVVADTKTKGCCADIYGQIEKKLDNTAIVNIGIGKIQYSPSYRDVDNFKKGDYIKISGARLDLIKCRKINDHRK